VYEIENLENVTNLKYYFLYRIEIETCPKLKIEKGCLREENIKKIL